MIIIYILAAALCVFVAFGFLALFAGPKGRGVPFVPTSRKRIQIMLDFSKAAEGKCMADLGSGDGRIVIAFARAGFEAHGYELNPILVLWSRIRIMLAGLRGRARIHFGNYWSENVSRYDVITIFGLPPMMQELDKKLRRDLHPGALVLSNSFQLPGWTVANEKEGIYKYRKIYE